jgi:hypothetical protein
MQQVLRFEAQVTFERDDRSGLGEKRICLANLYDVREEKFVRFEDICKGER